MRLMRERFEKMPPNTAVQSEARAWDVVTETMCCVEQGELPPVLGGIVFLDLTEIRFKVNLQVFYTILIHYL